MPAARSGAASATTRISTYKQSPVKLLAVGRGQIPEEILGERTAENKKESQGNSLTLFKLPLLGSTAQRQQAAEPGGASESGGLAAAASIAPPGLEPGLS